MGKAAAEADGGRCRRHPEHRQSVGVCPFCLTEKLQRHVSHRSSTATSSRAVGGDLSFYSSVYSSSDASSSVSFEDAAKGPRGSGGRQLMKTWSLVFAARGRRKERMKKEEKGEKERFWRRLFGGSIRRKKKEEGSDLLHSQTVKEKPSAKWIY